MSVLAHIQRVLIHLSANYTNHLQQCLCQELKMCHLRNVLPVHLQSALKGI